MRHPSHRFVLREDDPNAYRLRADGFPNRSNSHPHDSMTDARIAHPLRFNFASIYGLLALFIASVVHVSTFTAFSMSPSNPLFWILHVGIFPLFFAMVFGLRKWSETRAGTFGFKSRQLRWRELLVYLPPWAVKLGAILFAYAMANFLLSVSHLPSGAHASATSVQAMDTEQARYLVRAFSGHWLVFYAVPTLYFLFVPSTAAPADTEQPASR